MPGSLHILVTLVFLFWLFRTTKIIFYVCLLTHFARQDKQNGNLKNKQNHAIKVTKIQKKRSYENDLSQTNDFAFVRLNQIESIENLPSMIFGFLVKSIFRRSKGNIGFSDKILIEIVPI